jgi:hypothetical protein
MRSKQNRKENTGRERGERREERGRSIKMNENTILPLIWPCADQVSLFNGTNRRQ